MKKALGAIAIMSVAAIGIQWMTFSVLNTHAQRVVVDQNRQILNDGFSSRWMVRADKEGKATEAAWIGTNPKNNNKSIRSVLTSQSFELLAC